MPYGLVLSVAYASHAGDFLPLNLVGPAGTSVGLMFLSRYLARLAGNIACTGERSPFHFVRRAATLDPWSR